MWVRIHNGLYDLTEFASSHPGGRDILETASHMEDATPMFESYHSLRDTERILEIAQKYRVKDAPSETLINYTYDEFYKTLQHRVQLQYFSQNTSKATWWWLCKTIGLVCTSMYTMYGLFVYENEWYEQIARGMLMGLIHVSLGFNVMHDASHCAVSSSPIINETLSRITNATLLWNHHIWSRHHVYGHHSYTGEITHDPDVKNSRPFLRKSPRDPLAKYIPCCVRWQSYLVLPILCGIPGQMVGQSIVYLMAIWKKRVWGVPVEYDKIFHKRDVVSYAITILYHMCTIWFYPVYVMSYYVSANVLYYMCVAPDHDTYESSILDHNPEEGRRDWGEIQVRRSSNFSLDWPIVCALFGGINYQIEHHLFPSVSHVHYPYISPIVKRTCKEYGIPYHSMSWVGAIQSCFKLYSYAGPGC